VAAFAVSGYANTSGRSCKPFNPLLGETYEADYPDKGLRFISEKVFLVYTNMFFTHTKLKLKGQFCFYRNTCIFNTKLHAIFDIIFVWG
jgi:hypothetical protein